MSEEKKLIDTIIIDTCTAFQKAELLAKQLVGTPTRQDWNDYGVELCDFLTKINHQYGFECVCILGREGTGKSYGIKTLEPGTAMWFNCDRKNPTWEGGRAMYGTKTNPSKYMQLPKTYKDVTTILDIMVEKNVLAPNRVAFIIGHIEEFTASQGITRERMKTLGKMTHGKMNIEDMFENTYYTVVTPGEEENTYQLDTKNTGVNTGRCVEKLFKERFIPNDFRLIKEALFKC